MNNNNQDDLDFFNPENEYIQQADEFDVYADLIKSTPEGNVIPILMVGPPGCGKTLFAENLAREFNAKYVPPIDGSPQIDRYDIEGSLNLVNGDTEFQPGPLIKAIQSANETGIGFLIINEINAIPPSEQISLNGILAEKKITLLQQGGKSYSLNSDAKLVLIGTMNENVLGISDLQEAFEDRFTHRLQFNYPKRNIEKKIIKEITNCDDKLAEKILDFGRQLRSMAKDDFTLSKIYSTRNMVDFINTIQIVNPKFIETHIENMIINKIGKEDDERESIRQLIDGKMLSESLKEIIEDKKEEKEDVDQSIDDEIEELMSEDDDDDLEIVDIEKEDAIKSFKTYINKWTSDGHKIMSRGKISYTMLNNFYMDQKKSFREYFNLDDFEPLLKEYANVTGKDPYYGGDLTWSSIKWIYRNRYKQLAEIILKDHKAIDY